MLFLRSAKSKHLEALGQSGPKPVKEHAKDACKEPREIISSVLKVVYPDGPGYLLTELQTSTTGSKILGDETVCPPSDRSYLKALAEAYNNVKVWDTIKQVLSIMVGIASYKALLAFIPGLTPYRYTQANLHRRQRGRTVPVPKKEALRLRIDRR